MTKHNGRFPGEVAQGVMLDDPQFLKEIVEQAVQEVLEAEMTAHIGAERYERRGHCNGH